MAWHKVDQNLPGHWKTMRLRTLRHHKNTDETSGFMLRVWGWTLDNKPDGMVGDVAHALAEALRVKDGEELLRHLREAEFVCTDKCAARGLDPVAHRPGRIHDWDQTGGELARQRAEDAERKRLDRAHRRGQHPLGGVPGCPKCMPPRGASSGQVTGSAKASSGQRVDARTERAVDRDDAPGVPQWGRGLSSGQNRTAPDHPVDASRARAREGDKRERETRQEPPTPRPVGRTSEPVEADVDRKARALLEALPDPRWRDALQALLIRGLTSANLCTWFVGTTLEERDGWAIVRAPNGFAVEWLTKRYRPQVAEQLGLPTSRVLFTLEGQSVELEPEPVEEES